MLGRSVLTSVAVGAVALAGAPGALAAFPGANGPIVYTQYDGVPFPGETNDFTVFGDVRAIGADGSGDRVVAAAPEPAAPKGSSNPEFDRLRINESEASPSPDGRRVAYVRNGSLWLTGIDGSGAARIASTRFGDLPSWSPDGKSLVFAQEDQGVRVLDVSAGATTNAKARTVIPAQPFDPAAFKRARNEYSIVQFTAPQFTQDGRSVVAARIRFTITRGRYKATSSYWIADADGSNRRQLFRGSGNARAVAGFDLSPDGKQIAFAATGNWRKEPRRVFVANLDGSGLHQVAIARAGHTSFGTPTWSPDGTRIAVAQNESQFRKGGELDLIDPATGTISVVRTVDHGTLDEPRWAVAAG